jgi:hypothetical protein
MPKRTLFLSQLENERYDLEDKHVRVRRLPTIFESNCKCTQVG